jgi:predicted PurR-regulated permease PerM
MRIIKYELLDISIMVSLLLTAFIIFMAFKGLSDELNTIFIKLNDSIIEKNAKIKELEEKLVTNNTKNQDETINNLTNLVINLNIEENIEEENVKQKKQYKKKKMC